MLTESVFLENEGADPEMGCHDISKSEHRSLKRGKGRFGNSGESDHRTGAKPKSRLSRWKQRDKENVSRVQSHDCQMTGDAQCWKRF